MIWVAVAAAGAAGAAARYVVDALVSGRTTSTFPWGTLVVNLTGSLLIGVLAGVVALQGDGNGLLTVAGGGFCGAYTTFSTLVYETWRLVEERSYAQAAANLATILLGWVAAAAGWALAVW